MDVLVTTGETTTVLENVKVIAADQSTRTVTFLVTPDDAHRLMIAGGQVGFRVSLWKSN